jgi:hypothetical protein
MLNPSFVLVHQNRIAIEHATTAHVVHLTFPFFILHHRITDRGHANQLTQLPPVCVWKIAMSAVCSFVRRRKESHAQVSILIQFQNLGER